MSSVRIFLPAAKYRTIYDKTTVNLIEMFVEEEYAAFPVATHDDMLDMLARIEDEDMNVKWPLSDAARVARQGGRPTHANMGYSSMKRHSR
jgi:hypothetical protein